MEYVWAFLLLIALAFTLTGAAILFQAKGTEGEFSYLLVLGTKVKGKKPGKMLQDRLNAAYAYLAAHPDVTCIVSGYQSGDGQISEAECMHRELTAMGIEPERIWLEPNASSTKENLLFAVALIEEKTGARPQKLGVLSSEHHLLRAQMLASQQGMACIMLPAQTSHVFTFLVNFLREIPLIWYYSIFK